MKSEGFNAHSKYMILKHALKENNVSLTCNLFSISRTTFYNWYRAYQKHGMIGLKNKEPKKPKMPNKVSGVIEQEILAYVERCPTDGPKRIYYELKSEGINIGESGIYNVLRRHNLSKKAQRIVYSKSRILHSKVKQKQKGMIVPFDNSDRASYPGHFVVQRIDFIGKFDGIGKIYQYSLYDVYSKLAVVKLYNRKQDIDIWYYFELKVVYLLKTFNLKIDHLISKKTKDFIPYFVKGNKYKEITDHLNIKHSFIEEENSSLLDTMKYFNEYLLKEFYSKMGIDKSIDSFAKVERAFHKFLRGYNFSRTISEGYNAGKTPAEIILEKAAQNNVDFDTLPLWILALLNQRKGADSNK
jgi:transposase